MAVKPLISLCLQSLGLSTQQWLVFAVIVMTGCLKLDHSKVINGLPVSVQSAVGWLIAVHCSAHKTALVISDVVKLVSQVNEMYDLLAHAVHNLFAKRPTKQAN